jgi:histidyl-tRNA synthetase
MTKVTSISGFPEWLPEEKLFEERLIAQIRSLYESFGYTPIETPAVELIATLASKGVVEKEIYSVRRLRGEAGEEAEWGLHFDLTVPLARYVAQHAHNLTFPFRRYQVQKVWRGDRPQRGRFREFYQFDIDVIARQDLPLTADAEVVTLIDQAVSLFELGDHQLRMNSRKLLEGFYQALSLSDAQTKGAIVAVDKLDKIGVEGVRGELLKIDGLAGQQAERILELAALRANPEEFFDRVSSLQVTGERFAAGCEEIEAVLALLPKITRDRTVIDFSLARGLDYYSGIIVEVVVPGQPQFGTVAGGGRYDNLASEFGGEALPGVGMSIGLTRLMDLIFSSKLKPLTQKCPTELFVTVLGDDQRIACNEVAAQLRKVGLNVEVSLKSPKLGKQIEYAEAKGIRFVLFLDPSANTLRVKDLVTKVQTEVADLHAAVKLVSSAG